MSKQPAYRRFKILAPDNQEAFEALCAAKHITREDLILILQTVALAAATMDAYAGDCGIQ